MSELTGGRVGRPNWNGCNKDSPRQGHISRKRLAPICLSLGGRSCEFPQPVSHSDATCCRGRGTFQRELSVEKGRLVIIINA